MTHLTPVDNCGDDLRALPTYDNDELNPLPVKVTNRKMAKDLQRGDTIAASLTGTGHYGVSFYTVEAITGNDTGQTHMQVKLRYDYHGDANPDSVRNISMRRFDFVTTV
jgi:hypothetical protein